jgi:cellulose synthase/poly-beta-1,6-N-acetylglucosamine synthase-like glycosyltransferase
MLVTLYILLVILMLAQLLYPFLTILAGKGWGRERLEPVLDPARVLDYACVITAYKNASIARPLVESLLRQSYPHLHIYLVADECPDLQWTLEDPRLTVLQPDPPLRLKVKSIIHATEYFCRPHDYIAVFDADNLAHPHFLEHINRYAHAGQQCIQGQRTAKNLDTTYAALDSMGEHYKNYIERRLPWLLGGSAVISGSGMATETDLYKAYLYSPEIEQGKTQWKKMLQEDKILQNFLLRRDATIAYAHDAIVYDEKVETADAVQTQRSRWLFSYFQNLPNALTLLGRGLARASRNQFYFGYVTAVLPMFIQVGVAGLLFLAGLFIAPGWALALLAGMGIFALGVLWALRLDEAPPPVWAAVRSVPRFIVRQMIGLLKMGNPNKNFKHTEHRKFIRVEDLLEGTSTGEKPPAASS